MSHLLQLLPLDRKLSYPIQSKTTKVYFNSNCASNCVLHVSALLRLSSGYSLSTSRNM